jgi:hypothetical protein
MVRLFTRNKNSLRAAVVLLGLTPLALPLLAYAQDPRSPTVTIRRISRNIYDPVAIIGFQLDGQSYDLAGVKNSPSIPVSPGWLERLSIIVRNVSPKTLTAGIIQFTCPALGNGHALQEPRIIDQFTLGVIPGRFRPVAAGDSKNKKLIELSVAPGQDAIFSLGNDFERMRTKLSTGPQPSDCTVHPVRFFFADDSMWSPLHFYKPNLKSERGYVDSTREEFGTGGTTK